MEDTQRTLSTALLESFPHLTWIPAQNISRQLNRSGFSFYYRGIISKKCVRRTKTKITIIIYGYAKVELNKTFFNSC